MHGCVREFSGLFTAGVVGFPPIPRLGYKSRSGGKINGSSREGAKARSPAFQRGCIGEVGGERIHVLRTGVWLCSCLRGRAFGTHVNGTDSG